jgi:hypothetical protein
MLKTLKLEHKRKRQASNNKNHNNKSHSYSNNFALYFFVQKARNMQFTLKSHYDRIYKINLLSKGFMLEKICQNLM